MELTAAMTLWGLFSMWLLFPYLLVPRILTTAAATLGWLEFIAVLAWGFGTEECEKAPCAVAETGRAAATVDLPALSVVVLALAVAHAIRVRTSTQAPRRLPPEPPGKGLDIARGDAAERPGHRRDPRGLGRAGRGR